ncbi:MAG: FecR domain-containing protein [Balneolales bacterium]
MKSINHTILEKFFNNTCTAEEAEQVLEWLDTPEGQKVFNARLELDIERVDEEHNSYSNNDLDSDKMLKGIHQRIRPRRSAFKKKFDIMVPVLKVAATALVFITASLFYLYIDTTPTKQDTEPTPTHYTNFEDGQNKVITLSDGSSIRLNSHSEIVVAADFGKDNREIELKGEAYFDIAHNADKPFIISTKGSAIRVLGTSFNVKASDNDVQVAVVEGSVSLSSNAEAEEERSVVLTQGQFGYLNEQGIDVEDHGVENYLSWMRGRLVFDDLKMDQVCTQLERIYDAQCSFSDESLKNLSLTTNISGESLEKVISVISQTLEISYERNGESILWLND